MKYILFIIVFFLLYYNSFAQTDSAKPIDIIQYRTHPITIVCGGATPSKYHGFDKNEQVEWDFSEKTYTGVIVALCDTEQCLVKLDTNNTTLKLYYSSLKPCSYCNLMKGERIQWWKDSGELYTGVIVDIKNKKRCFVRLYEDSTIVDFDLSHTDVSPCNYCKFKKGDRVRWRPTSGTYTEWYNGTIANMPKDKSNCFIKPDYDTTTVINFYLLKRTPLDLLQRNQPAKK